MSLESDSLHFMSGPSNKQRKVTRCKAADAEKALEEVGCNTGLHLGERLPSRSEICHVWKPLTEVCWPPRAHGLCHLHSAFAIVLISASGCAGCALCIIASILTPISTIFHWLSFILQHSCLSLGRSSHTTCSSCLLGPRNMCQRPSATPT